MTRSRAGAAGRRTAPGHRMTVPTVDEPMTHEPIRSTAMNLMYEELARARHRQLLDEAASERRALAVRKARQAQRRERLASLRARRALALVH